MPKSGSRKKLPHFYVITVTKNEYESVRSTNQSLLMQKYRNWTHLIIDGKSRSTTVNKLKKLSNAKTLVVSESDKGIYNAMNKGWKLAPDSSWIIYLNSGDYLIDNNSLNKISDKIKQNKNLKILIAPFEERNPASKVWYTKLVSRPNVRNQLFCYGYASHQGMAIKKIVFSKLDGFNENFEVASDWDFYIRSIKSFPSARMNRPFSCFLLGGYSTQNIHKAHKELVKLRQDHLELSFREKFFVYLWESIFTSSIQARSLIGNFFRIIIVIFLFLFKIQYGVRKVANEAKHFSIKLNMQTSVFLIKLRNYKPNRTLNSSLFKFLLNVLLKSFSLIHLIGKLTLDFLKLFNYFFKRSPKRPRRKNALFASSLDLFQQMVLNELGVKKLF